MSVREVVLVVDPESSIHDLNSELVTEIEITLILNLT